MSLIDTPSQQDPAYQGSVMWHGVALLPRLRALNPAELRLVINQASELNSVNPLFMQPFAGTPQFKVPALPSPEPDTLYSGCQVIAIMVFGLWVSVGEDEELCEGLMRAWPIKEAVALCPRPKEKD